MIFRGRAHDLAYRFEQHRLWTPRGHRFERALVSAELARFRLDVLHSPDFVPPLRGARRHLVTVHDLAFLRYPEFMSATAKRYDNERIERAASQADHILAASERTKSDLLELLGVPAEKVTVQLQGVARRFRPVPPEELERARARLRLPEPFFLFVGTFEPRKNIPTLLEAYGRLRTRIEHPPSLVLVGRVGWLFDESLVRSERDGVVWKTDVDDRDLPALYGLATALVLPSFYEGFGLPVLEAMTCGTVPVVSGNSSLPEIVGDVGAVIDPYDAESIAHALHRAMDPEWRRDQELAALRRAELFDSHRSASIALGLYERLAEM